MADFFRCPACGAWVDLREATIGDQLIRGLRCCGSILEPDESVRMFRQATALEAKRRRERKPWTQRLRRWIGSAATDRGS